MFSNKRRKVTSGPESHCLWLPTDQAFKDLVSEIDIFMETLNLARLTAISHSSRAEINSQLNSISHVLYNTSHEARLLQSGEQDLCDAFDARVSTCLSVCSHLYDLETLIMFRKTFLHVPDTMRYDFPSGAVEKIQQVRGFLSHPAFLPVCDGILQLDSSNECHQVPNDACDRIVWDLHAVLHGRPAPSFFVAETREPFPSHSHGNVDKASPMPGAFPEDDKENKENLTPAPSRSQDSVMSGSDRQHPRRRDVSERVPTDKVNDEFRHALHTASEGDRLTSKHYVSGMEPGTSSEEPNTSRSILKRRRRAYAKWTPACLRLATTQKAVRFMEDKPNSRARSQSGLHYRRQFDHSRRSNLEVLFPQYRGRGRGLPTFKRTDKSVPSPGLGGRKAGSIEEGKGLKASSLFPDPLKDKSASVLPRRTHNKTPLAGAYTRENTDVRIEELLGMPSAPGLTVDENVDQVVGRLKDEAARKAAEELKRVEEELRKAAEAERLAAEKERKAQEKARRAEEERRRREWLENLPTARELQAPREGLVSPLSDSWLAKAQSTLEGSASLSWCTTPEGTDLRRHDFASVLPETQWLNDEIINGSIMWLDRCINGAAGIKDVKKQTRKCLTLNSFFSKALLEKGTKDADRKLRRSGVTKENMLEVETMLMPVCLQHHWTLLVIRPALRTVSHLDSLNPQGNKRLTDVAMSLVRFILQDKFEESLWRVVRHEAPRQTNGYDCGVFTITNAICLSMGLDPAKSYAATEMSLQRKRIACVLLNGGYHGDFSLERLRSKEQR
ncbi:hypothetical protein RJ55_07115 [Drechmeria coniospora]|nr:hypothetical protein RJ55_07115 [Drechmeria coniospora]